MRDKFNCKPNTAVGLALSHAAAAALICCIQISPSAAVTPEMVCQTANETTATDLANRFIAKLQTRHPDQMTRLFASDGTLLGVASPSQRTDYATVREYFLYFLQYEPQLKFKDQQTESGCNFLIASGNYTWSLKLKNATRPEVFPARFRTIYEFENGDWRIAEHIEELTASDADAAAFQIPAQRPRVPVAVVGPAVPAVAGYLKRSDDAKPELRAQEPPHTSTNAPAKKPIPDPVIPTSSLSQSWFDNSLSR